MKISHKLLKRACQTQVLCVRQIIKNLICTIKWHKQFNKIKKVKNKNQTQMAKEVFKEVRNSYFSLLSHPVLWLGVSSSFTMANTYTPTSHNCSSTSFPLAWINKPTSPLQALLFWSIKAFSQTKWLLQMITNHTNNSLLYTKLWSCHFWITSFASLTFKSLTKSSFYSHEHLLLTIWLEKLKFDLTWVQPIVSFISSYH